MQIVINVPVPRRRVMAAIFLAIALAAPSVALASHVFADVPNGHPQHADIAAIGLAGISNGCGGGNFCPDAQLIRSSEASFLRRGLGRVAGDTGSSITVPDATLVTVAETTITPGIVGAAVPGANGFLKVDGSVTLYEGNPDNCICSISVRVYVNNVAVPGTQYVFLPDNTVFESGSASINVVLPITAGAKTVSLRVNEYQGTEDLVAYASMSVLYVPFGATGTDTEAPAEAPAEDPIVR
jgi:hypothetical protein